MLLSPDNTRLIIETFLNKYQNQREAAKTLNLAGFRAPEGGPVLQVHIARAMAGSGLQLRDDKPEEPPEVKPPLVESEEPKPAAPQTVIDQWEEQELGGRIPDSSQCTFSGGSFIRTFRMSGRMRY